MKETPEYQDGSTTMKPQFSEGLIIKQIDFHEYDKIITLLTKDQGKKTGVLKGAKRINSAHLGISEPFTHVNVQYVEKPHVEMVRIRKLGLLNSFYPIRLSYEKILYASYFAEWIHLCVIDPQEALHFFDLLLSGLENLQPSTTYTKIRVEFEKNLLKLLGIWPDPNTCLECSRPLWVRGAGTLPQLKQKAVHQLDCAQGGFRCPRCALRLSVCLPLSPGTLSYLLHMELDALDPLNIRPTAQNARELDDAFSAYFQYHLGKIPKTHAFLKTRAIPARSSGEWSGNRY